MQGGGLEGGEVLIEGIEAAVHRMGLVPKQTRLEHIATATGLLKHRSVDVQPRVYQHANGDKFEGHYADDIRHGKGKPIFASGEVKEGIWENGEFLEVTA